jgi:hypothetical protein
MAVGNHDIFWYGVTDGEYNSDKIKWARSCDDKYPISDKDVDDNKRFTKGKFINRYLAFIPINYAKNSSGYYYNRDKNAFVQEVCVKRFRTQKDEYSSFILQKVNIPAKKRGVGLKGIIIDTVTYTKKPLNVRGHFKLDGHYNSGETGELTKAQRVIIKKWSDKFAKNKKPFMIFGHHPLKELIEKDWLKDLIKNNPYALGYTSAHTHLGYVDNKNGVIEVNVGSVTDYPNEIRVLDVNPARKVLKSTLYPISPSKLDNTPWCDALYDYTSVYPDNYLSYQFARGGVYSAHHTHEATLNISITTYLRLFEDLQVTQYFYDDDNMVNAYNKLVKESTNIRKIDCFKGAFSDSIECRGDKSKILKRLDIFDKNIQNISKDVYVPNLMMYGSCQVLKSSKAEWIGNYSNAR